MRIRQDVLSRQFAARIAAMIDSKLIHYGYYYDWADDLIAKFDEPPIWLLELATIRYYPDAVAAISRFVYAEPQESLEAHHWDQYISCLFVRYRIGAISWATFLTEAGKVADCSGACFVDCEHFYIRLNKLEESEYSKEVEFRQATEFEKLRSESIGAIQAQYKIFLGYFRSRLARGEKVS